MDSLKSIERIVTHPGPAHRDEFVACCLLLAHASDCDVIHRREPTKDDLVDPRTAVVDVGQEYTEHFNNFDHHHFPRSHSPVCALTLVLRAMHLEATARASMEWLEHTEILDSKGPQAMGRHVVMQLDPDIVDVDHGYVQRAWDALRPLLSPIEAQILRMFSKKETVPAGSDLFALMQELGEGWLDYLRSWKSRREQLDGGLVRVMADAWLAGGSSSRRFTWVDARAIPGDQEPTLGLEAWLKERGYGGAAVVVSNDDRGDGLSLFRRDDHPMFDFSRLEGHPLVKFAHRGGFIAKTHDKLGERDLVLLLEQAIR